MCLLCTCVDIPYACIVSHFTVSIHGYRYAYEISVLFTLHVGGSRKSAHRPLLILDHDRPESGEVEEEEEDLPNDFEPEEVNRGGGDDEEKVVPSPIAMSNSQPKPIFYAPLVLTACELLSVSVLSFHLLCTKTLLRIF